MCTILFIVYHSVLLLPHPDACPRAVALNEHMVIKKPTVEKAVEGRCNLIDHSDAKVVKQS